MKKFNLHIYAVLLLLLIGVTPVMAKNIYIGDSHTVGICSAVGNSNLISTNPHAGGGKNNHCAGTDKNGDYWLAEVGQGLPWTKKNWDKIANQINDGDNVIIMIGANGSGGGAAAGKKLADFINEKLKKHPNANFSFVTVNPHREGSAASTNAQIEAFNRAVKNNLDSKVNYIDTYSQLKGRVNYFKDGIHYLRSTNAEIYNTVNKNLGYTPAGGHAEVPDDSPTQNGDGSVEEEGPKKYMKKCTLDVIRQDFEGSEITEDGSVQKNDRSCWMCHIVNVMIKNFLYAAEKGLVKAQELGEIILKYGFALWLLYYLLTQVSSTNPTSPGQMLQNILIMGFKVALALVIVRAAIPFISQYLLIPLVEFGADYGRVFLDIK